MQHCDTRELDSRTYSDNDTPWPGPHEEELQVGTRILNEEADQNISHTQSEPWPGLSCDKTKDCTNAAKRRLQLEKRRESSKCEGLPEPPSRDWTTSDGSAHRQ